jgi:ergothioneine biosynthesis protein EgtB
MIRIPPALPLTHHGLDAETLLGRYRQVRSTTEWLVEPLTPDDMAVQAMPDASPVKWHLAHSTWFFETFVLKPSLPGYQPFHPQFEYLFNSYYNAIGPQWRRPERGLLTRPTIDEIRGYRAHVDIAMERLLEDVSSVRPHLLALGWNHEQQHQELIVTDLKYLLAQNPLHPVYRERPPDPPAHSQPAAEQWIEGPSGLLVVGHAGDEFAFDNEGPSHEELVRPFRIARRLVTNREYAAFIADGGYRRPELWLADGWAAVQARGWSAPLYWEEREHAWWSATLAGLRPVRVDEPVCHVSFYEADAYARWRRARLPTEAEWEVIARTQPVQGNFLDTARLHPAPPPDDPGDIMQLFGDVWEWTGSPYLAYPGYRPAAGALGEYNAKFMCNQFVLRGGSCATPLSHIRFTYRNFFPPDARWQFSGIRLATDA